MHLCEFMQWKRQLVFYLSRYLCQSGSCFATSITYFSAETVILTLRNENLLSSSYRRPIVHFEILPSIRNSH